MKKIIIVFLVFSSILFASAKAPLWLITDPDSNFKYFRGVSTWYITNDAMVREASQKDALNSGFSNVSDYFGLNIKSTFDIKTKSDKNGASTTTSQSIKTKTNQLIFDMKPFKSFMEYSEDGDNFRLHILLKLSKVTESKIKKEMKKDKKEFDELTVEILNLIEKKDFFKAQNLLEVAKGKRAAYIDDTLFQIQSRVDKLKKEALFATLEINKKSFLPNEEIQLEVSLNDKGYLYLFYDTGSDIEMLFPNKYARNNYLRKQELVSFPNDDINQLLAYEESLGLKTSIYAVASKENLTLQRYKEDVIDGIYIFNRSGEYKQMIAKCIAQANCTKSEVKFNISNKNNNPKILLEFNTTAKLKKDLRKYLKLQGIVSRKSSSKIVFNITKKTKYSHMMGMNISKYDVNFSFYKNNNRLKYKNMECDKEELFELIEKLYIEAI